MAINKTYEELVESAKPKLTEEAVRRLDKAKELEAKAKELELEQSGTLVELSDRERALVYGE